jgi:hypothetical protein
MIYNDNLIVLRLEVGMGRAEKAMMCSREVDIQVTLLYTHFLGGEVLRQELRQEPDNGRGT